MKLSRANSQFSLGEIGEEAELYRVHHDEIVIVILMPSGASSWPIQVIEAGVVESEIRQGLLMKRYI